MKKDESRSIVPTERIEGLIYVVRGQKIILDQDLAMLYGVDTGSFNRAINRNQGRFPKDFAFRLTNNEWAILKCQFGISSSEWGGRRSLPMAFTEHGVAMASNLLKSDRAVEMSVEIVRAFIRMRQYLTVYKEMGKEFTDLKSFLLKHSNANNREFRRVWQAIEKLSEPQKTEQRKIGFDLNL